MTIQQAKSIKDILDQLKNCELVEKEIKKIHKDQNLDALANLALELNSTKHSDLEIKLHSIKIEIPPIQL